MTTRNLPEREGLYHCLHDVSDYPVPDVARIRMGDSELWAFFVDAPPVPLASCPDLDIEFLSRIPSPAVCEAFQDWRDARAKNRPLDDCWTDGQKLMYADDCDKAETALIDLLEALEAEGAE